MSFDLSRIQAAAERIAPYIVETPMMRMPNLDRLLGCQVYGKAECMQVTGAFKYRGVMSKVLTLSEEELARGVVTASSGNHGRALAYAAKRLGIPVLIVIPYGTPAFKVEAIRSLGAEIVQCEAVDRFDVAARLCKERGAVMIPPYNDEDIMAGQGTAGLEIVKQMPDLDAVVVPASGGGLISGVATAVKGLDPGIKVIGAEPAVLPRYSASLAAGEPVAVPQAKTVADALVSNRPGPLCFPYVKANVDRFVTVDEEWIPKAQKMLLLEGKIAAEASSAIGMAAVLQGKLSFRPEEKVCFVISGGGVGADQLAKLLAE